MAYSDPRDATDQTVPHPKRFPGLDDSADPGEASEPPTLLLAQADGPLHFDQEAGMETIEAIEAGSWFDRRNARDV